MLHWNQILYPLGGFLCILRAEGFRTSSFSSAVAVAKGRKLVSGCFRGDWHPRSALGESCKRSLSVRGLKMAVTTHELKKLAGYKAVDDYVKSGMLVGLGTGSTAAFAVERVGMKLRNGELQNIIGIPTSTRTQQLAQSQGIPLCKLDDRSDIDVVIDGADSIDLNTLALVKGGGGALLQEKMVESTCKKFIVVADESKLTDGLGPHFDLPVEITQYSHDHTRRQIEGLPSAKGCKAVLRLDGSLPYTTENGNFIMDLKFKEVIKDVCKLQDELRCLVGVVENGLFIDLAHEAVVASPSGLKVLSKKV